MGAPEREETAVLAVELARALETDFEGSAGGVEPVDEHAFHRRNAGAVLLVLQRTHGGQL